MDAKTRALEQQHYRIALFERGSGGPAARQSGEPAYEEAQEATKAALARAELRLRGRPRQRNSRIRKSTPRLKRVSAEWRQLREKERGSLRARATVQPYNKIPTLVGLGIAIGLFFTIGILFMESIPPNSGKGSGSCSSLPCWR
jgi:hypothetical protein